MKKVYRFLLGLLGAVLGLGLVAILDRLAVFRPLQAPWPLLAKFAIIFLFFILFFIISGYLLTMTHKTMDRLIKRFEVVPLSDVLVATGGLLIGLLIAMIVSGPVLSLSIDFMGNTIGVILAILLYAFFGILGVRVALSHKEDLLAALPLRTGNKKVFSRSRRSRKKSTETEEEEAEEAEEIDGAGWADHKAVPKILDTSVIIDGRIFEVIQTGFLEGPFVVSHYVLDELQHISDSPDALRRARGRGGLDALHRLQQEGAHRVIVDNANIDRVKEVDVKLLFLTQKYEGKIVTNDYNLNKVAAVQEIKVLNVNDLANALKPIVIPGEEMEVHILKPGKEIGQGLAYLEDGTMIVVEDGYDAIGETVMTRVTSVLQTSAGKMIFTRIHP